MRIKREMNICAKANSDMMVVEPCVHGSMYQWKAILKPSENSMYSGMELEVEILFPDTYPYEPPHITFVTPIFHPNININGSICISVLSKDWSPALTIEKTLLSIMSLLEQPNPEDPLRMEAADLYLSDINEYKRICRDVYDEHVANKKAG